MIKPDYENVNDLILVYPKNFIDKDYSSLSEFYERLIDIIPSYINLYVIGNGSESIDYLNSIFPDKVIFDIIIKDFNELWLRDLMGFNMDGRIIKPIYSPTYCIKRYNNEYLKLLDKQVRTIIDKTIGKEIIDIPIVWDGGNLVTNGKIGFITEKIFDDNNSKTKNEVLNIIRKNLLIEPIIIPNPNLEYDKLSHSDGYMSFLNENEIILSKYPDWFYEEDKNYLNELEEIITNQGISVNYSFDRPIIGERIPCQSNDTEYLYSSRGIYVNYLNLNDTFIIPEYSIPKYRNKDSIDMINYNQRNYQEFQKYGNVSQINCDDLSKLGGVLHCISFTN